MTEMHATAITAKTINFLAEKYRTTDIVIHSVDGGYSRNRRAIIDMNGTSVFAKEVDTNVLPDDGTVELAWLKKDYEIVTTLAGHGVDIVPEWAELHLNGHLLLLPSYKKDDGWHWTPPKDATVRTKYIQAVIDATKQLEATILPDELTERLSLQPFFRDEIASYPSIAPLFADGELRTRLIDTYVRLQAKGGHLLPMNVQMVATLRDDDSLKDLQKRTRDLARLPNDCLNHCDVRSDNIAYNEATGQVKFVDWNQTSYAPAKFGATEFLLDMARRGVDVTPWYKDMSVELLAATVGYYMIRSLKAPLAPGSTLRQMQAETAAVTNFLYRQLSVV